MAQKKLAVDILGILIVLLVAPLTGVSASASDVNSLHGSVPTGLEALPTWQQVNSNGFGDQQTDAVSALAAFNGYLYAATSNATDGARIFRAQDGLTWSAVTQPGFGIPHDTAPPAILDLTVFNARLYASTGRGDGPGQIWRTLNGVNWAPMVIAGFGDPDTVDITALAEYNGMLYAGATNLLSGAQIWRSYTGDSNSWSQVAPAVPGTDAATVTGLAVFDGALYAAIESDAPAQIWRSYGGEWTTVVIDGFGNSLTTTTGGMAAFAGYLYVGAGNTADGAQLWRTDDGENWEPAIDPGFGDPNNQAVAMVFVFQNHLYAGVENATTGIELWRSTNGTLWELVNQDGFGDSNNSASGQSNASTDFLSQLYIGTSNAMEGGELWRMQESADAYGVALSPDDSSSGPAGGQIYYTITVTNTGNVSDTFNLLATGNSWTTALSSQVVTLTPSTSAVFTVTVAIPPNAEDQESDTVTITATSQGDSTKSDTAVLTTVSTGQPTQSTKICLPIVLMNTPQ